MFSVMAIDDHSYAAGRWSAASLFNAPKGYSSRLLDGTPTCDPQVRRANRHNRARSGKIDDSAFVETAWRSVAMVSQRSSNSGANLSRSP